MEPDEIQTELAAIRNGLADNTKSVNDLVIVILGKEGQGGCLRNHTRLAKDFYNFRLIVCIIFGSAGLFGGGGFFASKLLGG